MQYFWNKHFALCPFSLGQNQAPCFEDFLGSYIFNLLLFVAKFSYFICKVLILWCKVLIIVCADINILRIDVMKLLLRDFVPFRLRGCGYMSYSLRVMLPRLSLKGKSFFFENPMCLRSTCFCGLAISFSEYWDSVIYLY